MDLLLVSTYPPERCGVAAYVAQTVAARRAAGEKVQVLTWGEGYGDFHLPQLPRGWKALQILPYCRKAGRVVFHYMPSFYVDESSRIGQALSRLALTRLFRAVPNLEVIVHELPWYPPVESLGAAGRLLWQLERRQWAAARDLCFHNAAAIETFRNRFRLSGVNARVVDHGRDFLPNYHGNRTQARSELGLDPGILQFTSVGFITAYKGYELAIKALKQAPDLACEYSIVGSPHPKSAAADGAYLDRLREQAASDPRVRFRIEYVDDAAFDRWLCAADAVLLPYRSSTSSSVLARCHLMGTPAYVTGAAGLVAELGPADRNVADAAELAEALRATFRSPALPSVREAVGRV